MGRDPNASADTTKSQRERWCRDTFAGWADATLADVSRQNLRDVLRRLFSITGFVLLP